MEKSVPAFIGEFQSAVIGTVDEAGHPFSSYAPYLYDDYRYYVLISDIATHAKNLRSRPSASLFFIEDEGKSENIFARRRISLQCSAEKIERGSQRFEELIARFTARFEMIGMLVQMQDFNLYGFTARSGEATFGFGEAYSVGGEHMDQLLPRKGTSGHKKAGQ